MTAALKAPELKFAPDVTPRHSVESSRLKALMDASNDVNLRYSRGEINLKQAMDELETLKDRHRTFFDRVLGR